MKSTMLAGLWGLIAAVMLGVVVFGFWSRHSMQSSLFSVASPIPPGCLTPAVILGDATAERSAADWETYKNPQLGLSLQYPSSWRLTGPLTENRWLRGSSVIFPEYAPSAIRVELQPADYSPVWFDIVSGLGPGLYPQLQGGTSTIGEYLGTLHADSNVSNISLANIQIDGQPFESVSFVRHFPWDYPNSYSCYGTLYSLNRDLILYLIAEDAQDMSTLEPILTSIRFQG
jgi:hypothetical protein